VPEKWKSAARVSWFYDMGNVFQTGNKVKFLGFDDTTPVNYHFDYANLKDRPGSRVQWLAPLGLFRFSYGGPFECVLRQHGKIQRRNQSAFNVLYRSSILTAHY